MKIDGVDFSNTNIHSLTLWDTYDNVGPFFIILDDKIRIGELFTVFIQDDLPEIYRFIERQSEIDYKCNMSISVLQAKTRKLMYFLKLKVELTGIKFEDDVGSNDILLTYKCFEINDETKYY